MMKRFFIILLIIIPITFIYPQGKVKYELNSINFEGNKTFSSSTLSGIIYSVETPWWFWRFLNSFTDFGKPPVYFDSAYIQIDINALKEFYNVNGFFRAKFSYRYFIDTSAREVNLIYKISENAPSTYGKLIIYGLKNIPTDIMKTVHKELIFDTTKRYNQTILQQKATQVVNTFHNTGYPFAKFDSTVILKDTIKNKAGINIYFTSGNRYRIDTVLVSKEGKGAPLVSNQLLQNITGIKPGSIYDLEKIRRSRLRLYRTGLFSTVLLSGVRNDTTDGKIPLRLESNIGLLNELSPELILNNQHSAFNVGLGVAYIKRNFFGNARKLTIGSSFGVQDIFNVNFGNLIKKFSFRDTTLLGYFDSRITIEQPYVFNRPIFATWETYATINKQTNYNNTLYGSKITFDFELPTYTFINHVSTSYTIEQSNEVYRTNHDSLSTKLISDIGGDFGSTTADNILFPTRGYNLNFHVEEANSIPYLFNVLRNTKFDGSMFYKVVLSSSFYLSLNPKKDKIFAVKFKTGYLHAFYGNFAGIPLNRTFYAGGSNSIRGWRANQLVPEGSDSVRNINGLNVKGGGVLLDGSFEYRYRFVENFGAVLFLDYGNTWLNFHQLQWKGVALATGFGLRYYTQIAPFRVDFGFKFYDPHVQKFIWENWNPAFFKNIVLHFGIGEAF